MEQREVTYSGFWGARRRGLRVRGIVRRGGIRRRGGALAKESRSGGARKVDGRFVGDLFTRRVLEVNKIGPM